MSSQTISDLDRLLDALRDLKFMATRITPDFLSKAIYSLLTLLVENPFLVGGTRYALSEETYVSPRAVGHSSCAVAF